MAVGDVTSEEVGSAARYNDNKVRYELIPTHLLESTARVFDYGTKKYSEFNWAKGMHFSIPIGCLKRHLAAIERGEDVDPESGERHIGHVMANALMLEHYMNVYPQMDDRPKWFKNGETNEGLKPYPNGDDGSQHWQTGQIHIIPKGMSVSEFVRDHPDLFPRNVAYTGVCY